MRQKDIFIKKTILKKGLSNNEILSIKKLNLRNFEIEVRHSRHYPLGEQIATLIGFLGTLGMIAGAMISAGGLGSYIDVPSILIVFGGSFFAVMYTAPLPVYLGSFGAFGKAFKPPVKKMDELITRIVELAGIARKDGMMALEGQEVPDKFFEKGLQMLVDGADESKLTEQLTEKLKA